MKDIERGAENYTEEDHVHGTRWIRGIPATGEFGRSEALVMHY